jgi:hypothetical protein
MQQGLIENKFLGVTIKNQREHWINDMEDPIVGLAVAADQRMMNDMDQLINVLEGKILAFTILYEMHTIHRFPSPQTFSSYCRLVKPERTSCGKSTGAGNSKIGNPHLKWAFTQIPVHSKHNSAPMKKYFEKIKQKHGPGKSKSILGHKFAVAAYHMLKKGKAFDEKKFIGG